MVFIPQGIREVVWGRRRGSRAGGWPTLAWECEGQPQKGAGNMSGVGAGMSDKKNSMKKSFKN